MTRAFTAVLSVLILSSLVVGQATTGQSRPAGDLQAEQGISKVLADFLEAWNKHDAKAFALVFAEDADFTNVAGISARGRAEVEKFHAPRFATTFKDTHQTITETKVRFIKPDVALVDARWEMTGAKNAQGQDVGLRKGLLTFVMTKEGNRWFITVMHNMNLPASPP